MEQWFRSLLEWAVPVFSTPVYIRQGSDSSEDEQRWKTQLMLECLEIGRQIKQARDEQEFQEQPARLGHHQTRPPDVQTWVPQQDLFQRWCFEEEKVLQQQLAARNRETQLELAAHQRQTTLQLPEVHKVLDHWPLRLFPSQILESHNGEVPMPLRIFLAPPNVQFERFGSVQEIPEIESRLAQGLREFLSQNYSLHSPLRPTEFLGGAWESKRFHGESSIKALFGMLKSEPTLILESEVDGDTLNFRMAYWGLGQEKYRYETIFKLSFREFVYESAKTRALKWQQISDKLLAGGKTLAEVNRLAEDNATNLEILQQQTELRSVGIDISELPFHYKVNDKDFAALCQFLITCHCLVASWVADVHHLVHHDVSPLLPEILPSLTKESEPLGQEVMQAAVSSFKDIFKALETERSHWIPELALKLAESLAYLPDQSWAEEQVAYSVESWLKQRQVKPADNFLEAIKPVLVIEDREYIENLKECFAALGNQGGVVQVNQLLSTISVSARPAASTPTGKYWRGVPTQTRPLSLTLTQEKSQDHCLQPPVGLGDLKRQPKLENVSLIHTFTESGKAFAVGISPRSDEYPEILVSGSEDEIKLWNLDTGSSRTLSGHSGPVLAINPDGQTLASSDNQDRGYIKIWHLPTGKLLQNLCGHRKLIYSLAISSDTQTLVSGSHKIKIWNLSTGKPLRTLLGHRQSVYSLAISPDGQILASGSQDQTIKLWHLDTGELIQTLSGHSESVYSLAINPDGQTLASSSEDKTIKLWHLDTGKLLRTLTDHSGTVYTVAVSPDGQTLASGSQDKTIKLWNLETGELLHTLNGHSGPVRSVSISADGQTLASSSEDKTIKIWRVL